MGGGTALRLVRIPANSREPSIPLKDVRIKLNEYEYWKRCESAKLAWHHNLSPTIVYGVLLGSFLGSYGGGGVMVCVFAVCTIFMFLSSFLIQIYFMIPHLLTKYPTHLYIHIPNTMSATKPNLQQNFSFQLLVIFVVLPSQHFLILFDLNHITPLPPFRYCI